MGRAISVKVPKDKVVSALRAKIEFNIKAIADNKVIVEANKADLNAWQESAVRDLAHLLTLEGVNHRSWSNQLEVTYSISDKGALPPFPEPRPQERELGRYEVEEVENAIRILEMSDEEFVNASTMKQIASYL